MDSDYNVQFCDSEANQDITGSPTAEHDATEIRLWTVDGTCIVAVSKNARSGMWHVSASDLFGWPAKARKAHSNWRDAMLSGGSAIAEPLQAAGY